MRSSPRVTTNWESEKNVGGANRTSEVRPRRPPDGFAKQGPGVLGRRFPVAAYGVAAAAVGVVAVTKVLVDPFMGTQSPFLLFALAAMVVAWFGVSPPVIQKPGYLKSRGRTIHIKHARELREEESEMTTEYGNILERGSRLKKLLAL